MNQSDNQIQENLTFSFLSVAIVGWTDFWKAIYKWTNEHLVGSTKIGSTSCVDKTLYTVGLHRKIQKLTWQPQDAVFDSISSHWGEGWEKPRAAQAPVVQKLDSAIHRINHYPADSLIGLSNTYPLDSAIQSLNNQDQIVLGRLRDIRIFITPSVLNIWYSYSIESDQ